MSARNERDNVVTIAFVTPTLGSGGAEQHIAMLCQHLDRARFRPVVYCLYAGGQFAEPIRKANVPVVVLEGGRIWHIWAPAKRAARAVAARVLRRGRRLGGRSHASQPLDDMQEKSWIRRLAWSIFATVAEVASFVNLAWRFVKTKPDLVSAHWRGGRCGLLVAGVLGVPSVYTEHSIPGDPLNSYENTRTMSWFVQSADRVIAVSDRVRDAVVDHLGVPRDRVEVIRHAVEASNSISVGSANTREACFCIGTLGKLASFKGHHYLLEAVAILRAAGRHVVCRVAGDGSVRTELEAEVAALDLSNAVEFLGEYINSEVNSILGPVDVVVVPSLSEALGIVALEAMACGKPVIASAVGGLPDVVKHGVTGLLVPPGDAQALAEAIASLMDDPELKDRMGESARQWASQFTPERITSETEEVYERVLAE